MLVLLFTPLTWLIFSSPPQGGPAQEAGPGGGDPTLPQVYAPQASYAQQGQGPSASVGRLAPLDFNAAHASSEYSEHPQLRVYQGPQLEGAEPLTSSSTVSSRLELPWRPEVHAPDLKKKKNILGFMREDTGRAAGAIRSRSSFLLYLEIHCCVHVREWCSHSPRQRGGGGGNLPFPASGLRL